MEDLGPFSFTNSHTHDFVAKSNGRRYQLYYDGRRLRLVAWKTRRAVYWVSNTLSQSLNNRQMLAVADSLTRLKQ